MIINFLISAIITSIVFLIAIILYWRSSKKLKGELKERKKEMDQQMYELAILKELGERIGYSLNVHKIIDVITGSLRQFIDYTVVSYMLIEPEKLIFKIDLEESVSRKFISDIKIRMLKSLSALLNKEFNQQQIEETLTGAILVEELDEPVRSYFNIPLVIGNKVVGVLTVANKKAGLYKEEEMTILYKITQQASRAVTQLQDVVQTEQSKINSMVESMADGIVMTDKDYRVLVVNPAAKKIIGVENEKEVDIFDFIDKLDGKFGIRGKLEESVKLDKVLIAEEVCINEQYFQIFVSPVKSSDGMSKGRIMGGVVIFHNISHIKEAEKMREDFTSMMVHELRSPLDGIKKMTEMMIENNLQDGEEINKEYIQMIYQGSSEMLELVNDLLDVAKIEAGKINIQKEPQEIESIILDRIKFYKTSASDAKLKLNSKLASNIPKKIDVDSLRISQVLNNFISNAIKFTRPGGKIIIQVLMHKKNEDIQEEAKTAGIQWFLKGDSGNFKKISDSLVVAVTDTGVGISSENINKLFSKFKQFKAAAMSKKKGTGLGLVIAKGIIESHGGMVGVGSKEGEGSTFYFTLPL